MCKIYLWIICSVFCTYILLTNVVVCDSINRLNLVCFNLTTSLVWVLFLYVASYPCGGCILPALLGKMPVSNTFIHFFLTTFIQFKHVTDFLSHTVDGNNALHVCCCTIFLIWKVVGTFSLKCGIFPQLTLTNNDKFRKKLIMRVRTK